MVSVTDPVGRKVTFTVNGSGDLVGLTDPVGNTMSFVYDGAHRLTSMTDPRGGVTQNAYDSEGRVIDQWSPVEMAKPAGLRKALHFSYDIRGAQTTVTFPEGNQERQIYEAGLPVQIIKAPGTAAEGTWRLAYDLLTAGPVSITDPNNNVTSMVWSADGRMLSRSNGVDPAAEFTYDPTTGLVLTAKDPSGVVTTTTYSHSINVASVSTPLNGSTTRVVTYQHANAAHPGDVTKVIDPRNKQWVYGYDSYGDVASVTDPAGNQSTTSYDLIGRPVTGVAPKGVAGTPSDYRSTVAYDLNGRASASFGPTGAGLVDSSGAHHR